MEQKSITFDVWTMFEDKTLTTKQVKEILRGSAHLFALTLNDNLTMFVVNGVKESDEIGYAALLAALYLKRNGIAATIKEAVTLYKKGISIKKKQGKDTTIIEDMLNEMESWVAWSSKYSVVPPSLEVKWTMNMPYTKPEHMAGLANIMLYLSIKEAEDGCNTTMLATSSIMRFLDSQKERSKKIRRAT